MSSPQGTQEVSHLFLDISGPPLSPEGSSRNVGRLLRNSRLTIVKIPKEIFSPIPFEVTTSESTTLLAEKNKGIAVGDIVPRTNSTFIKDLFVIDDVTLIAVTQSGTVFLMRVYGVPYKKYTADATTVIETPALLDHSGEVDVLLPLEDVYLKGKDISVVRFEPKIFEGDAIKTSQSATIVPRTLNTGVSVGFPVPKSGSNTVIQVFPVSSDKVIAITESGAMYFIANREKIKKT